MLAARIDRLAEREKQVLQSASVIGKTFEERLLAQVVELPERDLGEALRNLPDAPRTSRHYHLSNLTYDATRTRTDHPILSHNDPTPEPPRTARPGRFRHRTD